MTTVATDSGIQLAAEILKAFSDPTRLRLAALLASEEEVCVCRLAAALEEADFKVSRHLAVLRAAGLVEARREGTWMHYRLRDPQTVFEQALWSALRVGLNQTTTVETDRQRLFRAACGLPVAGPAGASSAAAESTDG